MKLIKAIVRPNKVDDVKEALGRVSLSGMTVSEVRGHGKQKGHTAIYRGKEYDVSLLPKMEIEVVVPDELVDEAVAAIIQAEGDARVLGLEGCKSIEAFDRQFVFVGLTTRTGRESALLTGSAEVKESQETASVLAVLDATNRWIDYSK